MATEQGIEKGKQVRLKSGSVPMSVEGIGNDQLTGGTVIYCVWFDGKKVVRDAFDPVVLELDEEN